MDSNDRSAAAGDLPLWAALALHLSCRVLTCLAACLVPWAPLGGWGGLCPLAGVGDPGWIEGGRGWRFRGWAVYVSMQSFVRPSVRLYVVLPLAVPARAGLLFSSLPGFPRCLALPVFPQFRVLRVCLFRGSGPNLVEVLLGP